MIRTTLLACSVLVATPVLAQPGGWGINPQRRARILKRFDVNKNGKLDPEERKAMHAQRRARRARLLARWDANKNGKLDPAERKAMLAEQARLKKKFDANGNGKLEPAERRALGRHLATIEHLARMAKRYDRLLARLDKNRDGKLSLAEASVDAIHPRLLAKRFRATDTDRDGKVSKAEYLAAVRRERLRSRKSKPGK